jgi:hypothetical protein
MLYDFHKNNNTRSSCIANSNNRNNNEIIILISTKTARTGIPGISTATATAAKSTAISYILYNYNN